MKLSEHLLAIEWLRQFDTRDVHAARLLLDSLKLVSFEEFEAAISRDIDAICAKTDGIFSIFTVDKKLMDPTSKPGSEDRLGHLLTNIERQSNGRILVEPTIDEMREKKSDHIMLIDDFVGSGQRVIDFWNAWAAKPKPATVRSWLSYGVCRLWLVGYAAHEFGIKRIHERITYLVPERVSFEIHLSAAKNYWPPAIRDFCQKNGTRTNSGRWPLGYGDMMCPLVFQHGCPDNCPAILWSNGLQFKALFPGRGIPNALYPCFSGTTDSDRTPEMLWRAGQYSLALSLIEEIAEGRLTSHYVTLLALIGLLLRGIAASKLPKVMTVEKSQIRVFLQQAQEMGLIDADMHVTAFGKDIVERSKRSFVAPIAQSVIAQLGETHYFPRQFQKRLCGVQRKTSNEPA
jgi:hypothetical protein